jgi:hypothetical protein
MSIADHFAPRADAGFVRTYDARAARRQFQVSVALVIVLAVAAFALGMLARWDQTHRAVNPEASVEVAPHFAQTLLDIHG